MSGSPPAGVWIGVDLGDRTIGIACSDELALTARGLETWRRRGADDDFAHLAELARARGATGFVVGLPRNMDGSEGPRAAMARAFAAELGRRTGLPVDLWDERLSTVAAERSLLEADLSRRRRREVIDRQAAALILQGYLDRRRGMLRVDSPERD